MSDLEICTGCGKPIGTGTLLEQYPEPPAPRTSLHRLTLLYLNDFTDFPTSEEQATPLEKETWAAFANRHRCVSCAFYLDNEGARYGFD